MTTIRATCRRCDEDVELTTAQIRVRICAETGGGAYCFECPACRLPVAVEAERPILDLLMTAGVPAEVWSLPEELWEKRDGANLTPDDILDLHLLLADDEAFTAGLATPAAPLRCPLPRSAPGGRPRYGTNRSPG
ncbi:MAG: hypothetical protein ACYDAD_15180 [Acidimicrobiales bacterium]